MSASNTTECRCLNYYIRSTRQVILAMDAELNRVLGYVIDENDASFDGVFWACTFLHNTLKSGLHSSLQSLASRWLAVKGVDWYEDFLRGKYTCTLNFYFANIFER